MKNSTGGFLQVPNVLLVLCILGLGIGLLWPTAKGDEPAPEVHSRGPLAQEQAELETLRTENGVLAAEIAARRGKAPGVVVSTGIKEKGDWPSVPMQELSQMAEAPETAGILKEYFRAKQRKRYASLYAALHLPEDKLASLQEMMVERSASRYDMADLAMAGADVAKAKKDADDKFATQLKDLLPAQQAELVFEANRKFLTWEMVQKVNKSLAYESQMLNETQLAQLLGDWSVSSVKYRSGVSVNEAISALTTYNDGLIKKTAGYLSPAQSAGLASVLGADAADRKMQLTYFQAAALQMKEKRK
jgi:hypothetical protein